MLRSLASKMQIIVKVTELCKAEDHLAPHGLVKDFREDKQGAVSKVVTKNSQHAMVRSPNMDSRIVYVDAFTSEPFKGNPCAVVPQAENLRG
jgi:hypothetical protein